MSLLLAAFGGAIFIGSREYALIRIYIYIYLQPSGEKKLTSASHLRIPSRQRLLAPTPLHHWSPGSRRINRDVLVCSDHRVPGRRAHPAGSVCFGGVDGWVDVDRGYGGQGGGRDCNGVCFYGYDGGDGVWAVYRGAFVSYFFFVMLGLVPGWVD